MGRGFCGKMSQQKGNNKGSGTQNKRKINIGDQGKEVIENLKEDSLILCQFRSYAKELLEKQDRYERIVKYNRDIITENKRIISLLHTIDIASKQETVLHDAKLWLDSVRTRLFKSIACELKDQDSYQYLRAYRSGLEEYVEAVVFYHYLDSGKLLSFNIVQNELKFSMDDESESVDLLITLYEYILGIADLTGELMRRCVNNLAHGNIPSCFETCNFVRNVYKGFIGCATLSHKTINSKIYTLKQTLQKIESVCYIIKVRGSEIPKHIFIDIITTNKD